MPESTYYYAGIFGRKKRRMEEERKERDEVMEVEGDWRTKG